MGKGGTVMQQIKISELKSHPRNTEFFDDISGEKWTEFLESIKTSGVIEPVIITAEKIIVSGHQRERACKELGIESVLCEVHAYENEDQILKDLLETNIRQRGDVGGSAKKVGRRIKELERLYGIRNGSAGNPHPINSDGKSIETQKELADQFGISQDTLANYKLLADMIPELEDLLDTGIVTKTTALSIMKNLSDSEQEELISSMDTTRRITQKQVQEHIDKIKGLEEKVADVMPDDYEETKLMLEGITEINKRLETELKETQQKLVSTKSALDMKKRLLETTADERAITSTNLRDITNEFLVAIRPFTIMENTYKKLPGEDQHEIYLQVEKMQKCINKIKTQIKSEKVGEIRELKDDKSIA